MKIQLIAVGKLKQPYAQVGCTLFEKRLKQLCRFEMIEVHDAKRKGNDIQKWKEAEGIKIERALGGVKEWIALDERGRDLRSMELASLIQERQNRSVQCLPFVIGGPDGLSEYLRKKAPYTLCLGKMTLPHELARLTLLEQLYRAQTIIQGTGYHRP